MDLPAIILFTFCAMMSSAIGVQINYVKVPPAVRNNSGRPVVLDCDYTVRPDDTGLVIKWFLNGEPAAVYQWIPPKQPQGLGPLRDRLDLSYRASDDPKTMHRALKIMNPTTDISGEYKCFVSTFNDEDFSARKMIVFEPEQQLVLRQSAPDRGQVNVSCSAKAVYPEPKLTLFINSDSKNREAMADVEVTTRRRKTTGRYDVTALATVPEDELSPASVFDCEMTIPHTGYTKRTSVVYYPEGSDAANGSASAMAGASVNLWNWSFVCAIWLIATHSSLLLSFRGCRLASLRGNVVATASLSSSTATPQTTSTCEY